MLRISQQERDERTLTLHLEGRIVGPWAGELRRVVGALPADGSALALDLAEVTFADGDGASLLANLSRRGVRLLRPSPFLAEQLKAFSAPAV